MENSDRAEEDGANLVVMRDESTARVACVILNTNRREDTLACLASLEASTHPDQSMIVLDNDSTDGSIEAIRDKHPEVTIIELDHNLGYAGNNNVGIKAALEMGADWVFLLNEDVVLHKDAITNLLKVGQSDPAIGILGPLVYHFDEPTVIQSAGGLLRRGWASNHRGQNQLDEAQFKSVEDVDWVSGCAILLRRALVEDIGSLDERFFYYWEETELCLRARKTGWRVIHDPQAKVWHKGVQRDYQPSPNITYYWTRNWLLMLKKHHAPLGVWASALARLIRTMLAWLVKPKWADKTQHRMAMRQGFRDFLSGQWGVRPE